MKTIIKTMIMLSTISLTAMEPNSLNEKAIKKYLKEYRRDLSCASSMTEFPLAAFIEKLEKQSSKARLKRMQESYCMSYLLDQKSKKDSLHITSYLIQNYRLLASFQGSRSPYSALIITGLLNACSESLFSMFSTMNTIKSYFFN
jgi:hypothetical protein